MTLKNLKITVDFSEQVAEIRTKIEELQGLIYQVERLKDTLETLETPHLSLAQRNFGIKLLPTAAFAAADLTIADLTIDKKILVSILKDNIEERALLIHKMTEELGISVK